VFVLLGIVSDWPLTLYLKSEPVALFLFGDLHHYTDFIVATALNIDPIHFAMVSLMAMHCGGITPPVGMCVFCVKAVAPDDIEVMKIFKGAAPFLFGMLALVVIFIFFPSLSTFLPNLMFNS
jgi:TRAP-type C4-dicarboxylate transport system permease large subunit